MFYGGHNLSVKGKVTYTAEYKRKHYPIEFVILNERAPALLGLETRMELRLVKGLGRLKQKHSIRLKPENQ